MSGAPAADDLVKGKLPVAKVIGRHTKERCHRLGPQPQASQHRPGAEVVDHGTVSQPNGNGLAVFGNDHVCAPIRHHSVIG
jgi:hypothetical protein